MKMFLQLLSVSGPFRCLLFAICYLSWEMEGGHNTSKIILDMLTSSDTKEMTGPKRCQR